MLSYSYKGNRVSVIIPTFNRADLIGRAIESVMAQTFPAHEIIVVDDGSTDNTKSVINQYKDKVNYIYQENKMVNAARNAGIKNASGSHVAFLDSDDEWLPHKLEFQMRAMQESEGVGMICSDDEYMTPSGLKEKTPIAQWLLLDDHYQNLLKKNFVPTSTVIVRKEIAEKVGYFDESLRCYTDYDMWLRIAEVSKLIVLTDKLTRYHAHDGERITTKSQELRFKSVIAVLEKTKNRNPAILRSWNGAFRKRLGGFYFDLGFVYYQGNNMSMGLECFVKSLKINPLQIKSYCFVIACVLKKYMGLDVLTKVKK